MKIIIVGAGKVGNTITEFLAQEDHDVVIIDINNKAVNEAINNYDIEASLETALVMMCS